MLTQKSNEDMILALWIHLISNTALLSSIAFLSLTQKCHEQARRQDFLREGAIQRVSRTKRAPEALASRVICVTPYFGRSIQAITLSAVACVPGKFWKSGCLRMYFVRFEGIMMWKQATRSEFKMWLLLKPLTFEVDFFGAEITLHMYFTVFIGDDTI